jgi:hypothetical protein
MPLDMTDATTTKATKLIQNICDSLNNKNSLPLDEDKQWEILCKELSNLKDDDQNIKEQHNTIIGTYVIRNVM